ncbi:SRPBCC domain-containing protein [Oryzobacter telluris]|uniref:SRPBCC domain-containing protein n=1 Tax=Oryzobacter telluris TaxID=3149179 RepID=UPI00370D0BE2
MTTTDSTQSVVDTDTFTVTRSIHIDAPAAKVWAAVTEPEHISRWFGHTVLDGSGAGARGTMSFEGHGSIPLKVESVDPQRSVSYRWGNDDALGAPPAELDEQASTVFTFTLEPVGGGTRLTVVETGFEVTSDPLGNLESHRTGWDSELDKLVALLESA